MKYSILVVVILFFCQTVIAQATAKILKKDKFEVVQSEFKNYEAQLKNRSFHQIDVSVINKETGEFVRGFGLGMRGKATIYVEEGSKLVLRNTADVNCRVKIDYKEVIPKSVKTKKAKSNTVDFKLLNNSAKSIPLIIPGVMNPNLSPFSSSGVELKMGQEILFRYKGKTRLLLVVDETINEGDKLVVNKLLNDAKRELD